MHDGGVLQLEDHHIAGLFPGVPSKMKIANVMRVAYSRQMIPIMCGACKWLRMQFVRPLTCVVAKASAVDALCGQRTVN